LETHGLLGSEEAVDFRAAGHADDALTEFREAGLARDVPPPESRPTSWVGQVLRWWPSPWRAVQEAAWRALNNTPVAQASSLTDETPR